nr:hypothetical protein [uncultured Emticicia sp.]
MFFTPFSHKPSPSESPTCLRETLRELKIKEQAEDLVAANGGKNRVTLRSEKAQTDVDLRGEAHFDKKTTTTYDTPHTKTSPRNMQAPVNQGARYNTTEKHANYNNTTQKEIRTLRKYLEKQQ